MMRRDSDARSTCSSASSQFPSGVQAYLAAIVSMCEESETSIVNAILFGSASSGGYLGNFSDIDLILVVADGVSREDRSRLRDRVIELESRYGLGHAHAPESRFEQMVGRIMASECSLFVCTRSDLLSGLPSRILDLNPAQAFFVDRIVIPSILSSAVTLWGEDLLPRIAFQPVRSFDVLKALFTNLCQAATSIALFPVLPRATQYAMATLKHSVRSCYFCYHASHSALEKQIEFFQRHFGPSRGLEQLLLLRRAYRPSFVFVVRCLSTLVRLHFRTVSENRFPLLL